MKHVFIILYCLILSGVAMGQSSQKPTWADGYHKDLRNSYLDVFQGSGSTMNEAHKQAVQHLVDERSRATGRRYTIQENNGNITMSSQDELTVKSRIVDTYYKCQFNNYEVYILVQTARHPDYSFENVSVTDNYPVSARFLVPGWAQMYKGQIAKGLCMLGGVVASGVGIILCENQRSDYKNKMKEQPEFAQSYNTKSKNWETGRNICIGTAAAFYVWSVIDGIASKGKRRVVVKKGYNGLSINPVATPDYAGFSLAYNF